MTSSSTNKPLQAPDLGKAMARRAIGLAGAEPLVEELAQSFAAILQAAVSHEKAVKDSLDKLLAPLLAPAGALDSVSRLLEGDEEQDDDYGARVSGLAKLLLPPVFNCVVPDIDPLTLPKLAGQAALQAGALAKAMEDLLKELGPEEPFNTILKGLEKLNWADMAVGAPGVLATTVVPTPDRVANVLRGMSWGLGLKLAAAVLAEMSLYASKDIAGMGKRWALALAIEKAANRLPLKIKAEQDVASKIGGRVHGELQSRYVATYKYQRDIVTERNFGKEEGVKSIVTGPSTGFKAERLEDVVKNPKQDPDKFFLTLRYAMTGWRENARRSWLRADLVDAGLHEIWEIKPISSLSDGVAKEALYRGCYNLIRRMHIASGKVSPQRQRYLQGGQFWQASMPPGKPMAPPIKVLPADFVGQAETQVLMPLIKIDNASMGNYVAVPFQIAALPGLIGYFVLQPPSKDGYLDVLEAVVAATLLNAFKKMMDGLNKLGKDLDEAAEAAKRALNDWMEGAKNWLVPVCVGLVVVLAVIAALAAAPPTGGGSLAALGAAAKGIIAVVGVSSGVLILSAGTAFANPAPSKTKPPALGEDKPAQKIPKDPTDVQIGPVRVCGIPQNQVPQFLAEVQTQMYCISSEAAKRLQESSEAAKRPQASGRTLSMPPQR